MTTPRIRNRRAMNENEVMRIRMRYTAALRAGMSIAEASAHAIEQSSFGSNTQAALASAPATVVGHGNVQGGLGESNGSGAAPLSPKLALARASENTGHDEKMNPEAHPDHAVSQALGQDFAALSECSSSGPSAANSEGSRERTASAPGNCSEYKVGRNRLSNGRWPAGVSGNPKGRKPKNPSNDLEHPSALEQALEQEIKIKQGGKRRVITRRTALREQTINQAIAGDHRARRDLMAYAERHGIDLFAGQHKAIEEGVAEAARSSSALTLSDAVLERLSTSALNELRKAVEEVEAEKNNLKKMH
jgi:Family of unknown function (DUF5681)